MGKIYDGLSKGIMTAMKNKDSVRTQALKNIKAKMIEFKTSNEGVKVCAVDDATGERIIPDSSEIAIVKKMAKELEGDIEVRNSIIKSLEGTDDVAQLDKRTNDRDTLVAELAVITEYIPKAATEDDIRKVVNEYLTENGLSTIEQKQMGLVIKYVKGKLTNADGKLTSDIVRTFIG